MKIPRLPDGDAQSAAFIDQFNLLDEDQQLAFVIEVATQDEELRSIMLDTFRRRGLLA